jgi:type IV pilus assembly protein PilC
MPYFKWYGLDQNANVISGIGQAISQEQLTNQLRESVTLIKTIDHKPYVLRKPINYQVMSSFYRQLSVLLEAGVRIDQALSLLQEHAANAQLKRAITDIKNSIAHGLSLQQSCSFYPAIFSPLQLGLLTAGAESGNMVQAAALLADYFDEKILLRKKLRAALIMPIITFAVFVCISCLIIFILVPIFADLFISMNQPIPNATNQLLQINRFLSSWSGSIGLVCSAISLLMIKNKRRLASFFSFDYYLLQIPFIGSLIADKELLGFLQSLALSVANKMLVSDAFGLAIQSVKNGYLKEQLSHAKAAIERGNTLAKAFAEINCMIAPECLALFDTAQESGALAPMLKQTTIFYSNKLQRKLSIVTSVLQPLLTIFLGGLIALLIIAIYSPIFDISLHVG